MVCDTNMSMSMSNSLKDHPSLFRRLVSRMTMRSRIRMMPLMIASRGRVCWSRRLLLLLLLLRVPRRLRLRLLVLASANGDQVSRESYMFERVGFRDSYL